MFQPLLPKKLSNASDLRSVVSFNAVTVERGAIFESIPFSTNPALAKCIVAVEYFQQVSEICEEYFVGSETDWKSR